MQQNLVPSFSRRQFVSRIGMVATSVMWGRRVQAMAPQPDRKGHLKFGTQTNAWPVNPHRFDTLLAVLAQIRQLGYSGFETGFRNLQDQFASPAEAMAKLTGTGLEFFGAHINPGPGNYDPQTNLAPDSLYEQVARGAASLGARNLILSGDPARDRTALKHKIDALNSASRFCQSVGLGLAYHNHAPEFASNGAEINALYTETDPSLVKFVLDAGHAYEAHADVTAFFARYSTRVVALHLRETRGGRLVSLGPGSFPLAQLAAVVKRSGWSGWVENEEEREDGSHRGLEIIEPAYKAMKEAFSA